MLGRGTAAMVAPPWRWIRRLFGRGDIHERQKWAVLWPLLARLPRGPLRLLDAGCGMGDWSMELAVLRPEWSILGIDVNAGAIATAQRASRKLGLGRVSFREADFMSFVASEPFDVVLSVASAHYLAESGGGGELFGRFRRWLKPGGALLLLGPLASSEAGYHRGLPRGAPHPVFTSADLRDLCSANDLSLQRLDPVIGRYATLTKRIDWYLRSRSVSGAAAYPLLLALSAVDVRRRSGPAGTSIMWLLEARAGR